MTSLIINYTVRVRSSAGKYHIIVIYRIAVVHNLQSKITNVFTFLSTDI